MTTDGWWIKGKLTAAEREPLPPRNPADPPPAESGSFLNFLFCGCQQKTRPITPQASHSPQALDDETIYLVCYSRGRDVYNGFARGKDLIKKGFL
jgi:hypothetical protein